MCDNRYRISGMFNCLVGGAVRFSLQMRLRGASEPEIVRLSL